MALCNAASAAGSMVLAGAEWTVESSYLYGGVVIPLPGSRLGGGLVQRYWIDRLTYRYEKDGREIHALAPGVEASLGLQGSGRRGWWGVYAGLAFRDTRLSPDDPGARARGSQLRPKGQVEGALDVGSLRVYANASYLFGLQAHWLRAVVDKEVLGGVRAGPEVTIQGDPDYDARKVGCSVSGLPLLDLAHLGLSAGLQSLSDGPWRPYVGVGFSALF